MGWFRKFNFRASSVAKSQTSLLQACFCVCFPVSKGRRPDDDDADEEAVAKTERVTVTDAPPLQLSVSIHGGAHTITANIQPPTTEVDISSSLISVFASAATLTPLDHQSPPPSPPPQPADDDHRDQIVVATSSMATVSTIQFSTSGALSSSSSSSDSYIFNTTVSISSVCIDSLEEGAPPIGEGSFGRVTKVSVKGDNNNNNNNVVKWIKNPTPADIKLFEREANIIASLNHPNILRFLHTVLDENGLLVGYMVENANLGSLRGLMDRHFTFDRVQLALGAARGCAYMHSEGIAHFDIKPANLLIHQLEDGELVVKVADFGTCCKIGRKSTLVGTPGYISPEMYNNDINECGFADKKSDVWSLGVVLWELETGRVPYDYDDDVEGGLNGLRTGVATGRLKLEIPVGCEDSWKVLIEKCLEIDPTERFSMEEVVEYLENIN